MAAMAAAGLVLIVDDYDDVRDLLAQYLQLSGFRVATAASGREAIEQARVLRPDAIVLDFALPDLDGIEVIRRIRAEHRAVKVLLVSGYSVEDRARKAGCDETFTKPCAPDRLAAALERLLT
jgi:CheY-like chemotaxis protein